MARISSGIRRTSSKKNKIILLSKQGETTNTIIANKVSCSTGRVDVVKREFLRSQRG